MIYRMAKYRGVDISCRKARKNMPRAYLFMMENLPFTAFSLDECIMFIDMNKAWPA